MRVQIWRIEAIENILWATQAVMQATVAVSESNGRSLNYHRGYNQGFEAGLRHVTESFETRPLSLRIWSREHIRNVLQLAQAEMQVGADTSEVKTRPVECKQGFYEGLEAALWCVATSFGVNLWASKNGSSPVGGPFATREPDLWFPEDIQNILCAIQAVMKATAAASDDALRPVEYDQGFEAALRVVAESLGIKLLLPANTASSQGAFPFWRRQDIEKKLLGIYRTNLMPPITSQDNTRPAAYWQGFEAALQCIAKSFGVRLYSRSD